MNRDRQRRTEGAIALLLFGLTIPAANWMLGHVGTVCVPSGPCLVPVWPGIDAPSGVLMIGLALVLRDIVQRRLGPLAGLDAAIGATRTGWLAVAAVPTDQISLYVARSNTWTEIDLSALVAAR